ncbi:hypothetical protein [Carboxylicivirga caseinilyticus]|uniref:hypothetical protein n=1 Tax=Carboxylicivirga caseinilyticus TaxID=3417572 RepID=UPI003D337719|nr:hypothetical protein [Marinilabiliaceae bacterium A049]
MNKTLINKVIYNSFLSVAVIALTIFIGCDDPYSYTSPQEYLDSEMKLLNEFYANIIDTVDNVERTWLEKSTAEAIDTVDNRDGSGMMLFHTKIGEGDSVKLYKRVGYRYTQYQVLIYTDTIAEKDFPGMFYYTSNEYSNSPVLYTTFPKSDSYSASSLGIPQGVNEAILNMRYGGECRVVLPSTINANSSYITTIFDLKITYLEN